MLPIKITPILNYYGSKVNEFYFFKGNSVEDAEKSFIPKTKTRLKKIDVNYKERPPKAEVVKGKKLPIPYTNKGKAPYGKELQEFLNQFPGVSLKVDGWPGKKSSDAFKKGGTI